ncbi:MAG: hypothetical protein JW860_01540 [Sedimentisphaerales bacterium]|nr:hypothetical protein [Sedimentisphaerales bacterium]
MKKTFFLLVIFLTILFILNPSRAVQTTYIEHNTEKQFKDGEPNQVVISSEGEISLARQSVTLLEKQNEIWVVNDIIKDGDGNLYIATSGKGYLYQINAGGDSKIIYGPDEGDQKHVFSLGLDESGRLLAGTGGQAGLLLRLNPSGKFDILFEDKDIKYIWDIVTGPAGRIYLATGPEGKVITLDPGTKNPKVLYQAREKNILALALDEYGIVYAGGDENGLVYRIDPGTGKATIAYDTGHGEISGLVFDQDGNLYVSTADAKAARPGAKLILSDGDSSRTEAASDKKFEGNNNSKENNNDAENLQEPGDDEPQEIIPAETPESDKKTLDTSSLFSPDIFSTGRASDNEVLQISPQGYVRSLFQKDVIILSLKYIPPHKLLLGTGNDGKLIQLETDTQKAVVLHSLEPSVQVSAVWPDENGTLYAGAANPGKVIAIKPEFEPEGFYISSVIDAKQVSQWGNIHIEADIPSSDTSIRISTRTGNTSDPEKGGWQNWTDPAQAVEETPIESVPGRFLQYRLLLSSSKGDQTAIIRAVKLAYMIPNLPPIIENITIKTNKSNGETRTDSKRSRPSKEINISWKTTEPNDDTLSFDVFMRQLPNQRWIRIARDLKDKKFEWDTETVADGRYEIKVTASDKLSNPPGQELTASRVSPAVVVDNTPPEIMKISYDIEGTIVRVNARVIDTLSVIGGVEYVLDSGEQWQIALPKDGIFDSRIEIVEFEQKIDEPGEHVLAVRFEDASGNPVYRNLNIVMPDKE